MSEPQEFGEMANVATGTQHAGWCVLSHTQGTDPHTPPHKARPAMYLHSSHQTLLQFPDPHITHTGSKPTLYAEAQTMTV